MHECRQLAQTGAYRSDSRSENWFGKVVAEVVGIDDVNSKTSGRAKVSGIIKKWLETKVIQEVDGEDENRHKRKFIKPGPWNDAALKGSADEDEAECDSQFS
jgi:hypothetical protein